MIPYHITYKDTGDIKGYSSSLVDFGDGYLLGIGYGNDRNTLKIEIYVETENGVVSLCSYERRDTQFSEDYKSYYIECQYLPINIFTRQIKQRTI